MDFFNNVGKKLGNAAKTAGKKSEELVEITKLNLSIGSEEDKAKKLFSEMGKEIYVRFVNGDRFDESINSKCAAIKVVEDNIEAIKEKIKNFKGHNSSPDKATDCNTEVEENYQLDNETKKENEWK